MTRYTVKQAAALTGVAATTLRAWERRYAVVEPERSASRYRLYGDEDLARLTRMAELVAAGTPASLAAEKVLATPPTAPQPAVTDAGPARDGIPVSWAGPPPEAGDLVHIARTFDPVALDRVLDEAFARGPFESVVDGWLMPALVDLGRAWAAGEVDVAGEHFVSGAVHRRLARWFEAARPVPGASVVLVGLPDGALHQLAAMAFATVLRRRGADVRYLGADVPTDSWVNANASIRPALVVVGVPTDQDAAAASDVARALVEQGDRRGAPVVLVGGAAAGAVAEQTGASALPAGLVDAAAAAAEAIRLR